MANKLTRFFYTPIDWFLLTIPIILVTIGIVTIYTITFRDNGWGLAIDQIFFAAIGFTVMIFLMFTDYRLFTNIPGVLYVISLLLLSLLLPFVAPSIPIVSTIFGATRWIDLGFFQLQPSEIFKLFGIIVASAYLAKRIDNIGARSIIGYLIIMGIPVAMVLSQPSLGTSAVLIVIFLTILIAAGLKRSAQIGLVLILAITIPIIYANLKPYQKTRVETFLNLSIDPEGRGYNVTQSLIAVGSGGLYGRGFGQGSQTVLNFLPVPHTDFIFAGFAEATGFVGSMVLLMLYGLLLSRILRIGAITPDPFAHLIAIGLAAKIFIQLVIHIGMNLNLMPVTGIPLPFLSYGGTSLIVDLAGIGILLNIHIRHNKIIFS